MVNYIHRSATGTAKGLERVRSDSESLFKNSEHDPAAEITAGPPVRQGQGGPMQRLCQKLTIGRYASTGDRRSDLTYRHGSDFGAGRKRRENLRQTRDTELENDPDKRSETARPNISLMHLVTRVHWEKDWNERRDCCIADTAVLQLNYWFSFSSATRRSSARSCFA